ncbi:C2 domain-containing protein [Aspergillus sp. HF37]|nr:C2 domain-containing protein [Aspergillus sp. HF37]
MGDEDGVDTEQEVTDPVTHLSVTKHDFTSQELKRTLENIPPAGGRQLPMSDVGERPESKTQSDKVPKCKESHAGNERLFLSNHEDAKAELIKTFQFAFNVGMGVVHLFMALALLFGQFFGVGTKLWSSDEIDRKPRANAVLATITFQALLFGFGVWGFRRWVESIVEHFWEHQPWESEGQNETEKADAHTTESTQWLNSLLASAWPLVNPDLFASLADTLEDSMQANLPKLINMISVEDLGQGSEALRILGVRQLPTDATDRSVSAGKKALAEGNVQENNKYEDLNSQQQVQKHGQNTKNESQEEHEEDLMKTVEAEEGESVSLEVTFAYKAKPSGRKLSTKAKSAHLFLGIYLPAAIWVEMQGIVGVSRVRLQLTPDPPFLAQCTFTFIGQPKVNLSCTPMFKHGLNVMNIPFLSSFVQTSFDAAVAKYVAPKSLTLDLKNIYTGDDFKKDTNAHGVVVVRIKRAINFQERNTGLSRLTKGSTDPYVSASWSKFGKCVWSTRVIVSEIEPVWDETGFIVVGREELNAQERLRLQLWDSDQSAGDHDLGFIDIGLNETMQSRQTNGRMLDRRDDLHRLSTDGDKPCTLDWSLGYFPKTSLAPAQLAPQTDDRGAENIGAKELPESRKDESREIEQQKKQDVKTREAEITISSPPSPDYPSGIFAIQIHQILGLEFKKTKRSQIDGICEDDDQLEGDDLLSSYCTIILNHRRISKTRTKPKSGKPTFNVGVERFIRDWRSTEIILSVRDQRVHDHDPLIGIVVLPLAEIFKQRSQVSEYFPLCGGIGNGRVRISMVFRSVQLQAPVELLGWDYGVLRITSDIKSNDLPDLYKKLGLKLRTSVQSEGMGLQRDGWSGHQGQPVELAVRQRYCSSLVVEFHESNPIHNHIPAFAILWLKEIPDEEEKTVTLPVWKGDLKRAEANCDLENGERLGHIEVRFRFRPGISGHHKKLAFKDSGLADVMEVLDIATDNKIEASREEAALVGQNRTSCHEDIDDHGWRQLAGKEHGNKLHRKTRKVKQWKSTDTAQRAKHKVEDAGGQIAGHFHHSEQDTDNKIDL